MRIQDRCPDGGRSQLNCPVGLVAFWSHGCTGLAAITRDARMLSATDVESMMDVDMPPNHLGVANRGLQPVAVYARIASTGCLLVARFQIYSSTDHFQAFQVSCNTPPLPNKHWSLLGSS